MKKVILLAVGTASAQNGGGFKAVVVPSLNFVPRNIAGMKIFLDFQVKEVALTFKKTAQRGSEGGAFAGYDYTYYSVSVAEGLPEHPIEANAIGKWVLDNQRELLKQWPEVEAVVNLTQHQATAEQVEAGVVEPADKAAVQEVLTFDTIPGAAELERRAYVLAYLAAQSGCKKAMIGGAPFFMSTLEKALAQNGIQPVYAFSQRESVETIKEDGSVVKSAVFRHVGFVEV